MDNKEYTYDIDKYTIGVDESGEDGIGMTVAKVENDEIYFLGNCYGENARCIDLLIQENQELKQKLENMYKDYSDMQEENERLLEKIRELKEQNKKEFIKYLEDEIKRINPDNLSIGELNLRLDDVKFTQYLIYKEILQKYKEIIGVSDENKKKTN